MLLFLALLLVFPYIRANIYFPIIHKYIKHQNNPNGPFFIQYGIHGYLVPMEMVEWDQKKGSDFLQKLFRDTILPHKTPWMALLPDLPPEDSRLKEMTQKALDHGALAILVPLSNFSTKKQNLRTSAKDFFPRPLSIPTGFILKQDYQQILKITEKFVEDGFLYSVLNPNDDFEGSPGYFLAGILFLMGALFTVFFYNFIKAVMNSTDISRGYSYGRLMGKVDLDKLPVIPWNSQLNLVIDDRCSICLEDFSNKQFDEEVCPDFPLTNRLRKLPCGHFYHSFCIDPWLLGRSVLCPLCKKNALTMIEEVEKR